MVPDSDFWRGRRVMLTGHTGFKGAWLAYWLRRLGSEVTGLALPAHTSPSLWALIGPGLVDDEIIADIRDGEAVSAAVSKAQPSIVIHMAAQSLVRQSYVDPVDTFAVNVTGTVHVLEALRQCDTLAAALIVTTDKVYANNESGRAFKESDPLGGHDPYSASKAAAEIAVASYASSFFGDKAVRIATARAGNVIGGGDWSADRLLPDVWRASQRGEPVKLRNARSRRPWQHVLEPLAGYLLYVEALAQGKPVPSALNFGPAPDDTAAVSTVAEIMAACVGQAQGWVQDEAPAAPEMNLLALDPTLAIETLGWRPRLNCEQAIRWSADWYVKWARGDDPTGLCARQIDDYQALA